MAIKARPINIKDIDKMTDGGSSAVNNIDYNAKGDSEAKTVIDLNIFGIRDIHRQDGETEMVYEDMYTRVGYLTFPKNVRIINPYLAGREYPVWAKMLGLSKEQVKDIVQYKVVWDNEEERLRSVDELRDEKYSSSRFVIGPDYLCQELDRTDWNEKINGYLYANYFDKLTKKCARLEYNQYLTTVDKVNLVEVLETMHDYTKYASEEEWFANGPKDKLSIVYLTNQYCLDLSGCTELWDEEHDMPKFAYVKMQQLSYEWQMEESGDSPEQYNILELYNLALKDNCKFLKDLILTYIFILPIGYRPDNGFGQYDLTSAYEDIIRKSQKIIANQIRKDIYLTAYLSDLEAFRMSIEKVFIGLPNKMKKTDKDKKFKSIAEDMKGKNGFIRDRFEGIRSDFTGRTVITLDPNLHSDEIGVPIKILEKIAEPLLIKGFRVDARSNKKFKPRTNMTSFSREKTANKYGISYRDYLIKYFNEHTIYGVIGRQPTLYYLGMQSFKIKPVEGNSILLSPLIVMPFNADFDGDQMHIGMPVTNKGVEDVANKMLFKNNIWYPKNGSLTVTVRHEIQFGLFECLYRELDGTQSGCSNRGEVFDKLCNGDITVGANYNGITAGRAAFEYCIFGVNTPQAEIDKEWTTELKSVLKKSSDVENMKVIDANKLSVAIYNLKGNTTEFLKVIDRFVKLGFAVSRFYPPAITVVTPEEITNRVHSKVDEFNKKMTRARHYVDIGLELEDNYNVTFTNEYKKLADELKKYLMKNMNMDNGYWRMVASGAKGDTSNMLQIFGIKGRVQKNESESFNTTIDGSYAGQLTGLEHFVTAYGSRKGIADKVLSTAKPGYMSRKLEHAGAPLRITCVDCSEGAAPKDIPTLDISPLDVIPFIESKYLSPNGIRPTSEMQKNPKMVAEFYKSHDYQNQLLKAEEILAKILVGRFCVTKESGGIFIVNEDMAKSLIRECWADGRPENVVRMRSPLTCKNPCCEYCYGRDLTKGVKRKNKVQRDLLEKEYGPKVNETWYKFGDIQNPNEEDINFKQGVDGFNFTYYDNYNTEAGTCDITTEFIPVPPIDKNIGFIAAQAIGEPGTQMTMKNFQKGGVAGDSNLTSSFDLIESTFDLKNFSNDKLTNGVVLYDPVVPVSGYLKKLNMGNNISKVIITETSMPEDVKPISNWSVLIWSTVEIKSYVERGDSILFQIGQVNVRDKIKYAGFESAAKYLLLNLYTIFESTKVSAIHFECILRNMICYRLMGNSGKYHAGDIITYNHLNEVDCPSIPILVGVKFLPKFRPDFMQSLIMESQTTYIPRAILTSNEDDLSDPIVRTAFGLDL